MFSVLLIVPYPELGQVAQKIYRAYFKQEDCHVDIRVIRAEQIERTLGDEQHDLIIGRGHSAAILKKTFPYIPVLEIPITGYDIMRALLEAKRKFDSKKVAVIISSTYSHDEKILSNLFNMEVSVQEVADYSHVTKAIKKAAENKYDTVIGGYSVKTAAGSENINTVTIETGEEAVLQIMHEAILMRDTIYKERERRSIYETINQTSNEGIIYVNIKNEIALVNRKILQMIFQNNGAVHGKKIEESYPFFAEAYYQVMKSKQPLYNELQKVQDTIFSIDYMPVIVGNTPTGVVITCQEVKKIQQIESQIRKKLSDKGLVANYKLSDVIRKSELMDNTVKIANKYASVSSNILIVGETGTGKELIAQGIHNGSKRRNGPFVAVNCAALPENLLESELFGYVEGAFTGSRKGGKMGFFEQAHHGTLFLDEISEIPINFQGKLLRALQERQVSTKDTDGDGKIDQYGYGWPVQAENASEYWAHFMYMGGADISMYEDGAWKSHLSSKEAIQGTQTMVDLVQKDKIAPESVVDYDWEAAANAFVSGEVAMMQNGSWVVDSVKEKGPDLEGKFGVAVFPDGPSATAYRGYPNTFNVLESSEHKDEVWKFLDYFYNTDSDVKGLTLVGEFCNAAGGMLYTKDFIEYAKANYNKELQAFLDESDNLKAPPLDPDWQSLTSMYGNSTVQQMLMGDINVEEGITTLDEQLKELHGEE
ncbi:extracellular solute-binding protein [Clostridium sp. C105KSO13]|uniref:extracellular solute-binding protein n=1 Tax=Clostridium sp. C105KSO13 TaxID=1776045 RepID=UPI00074087C4|nr:extracellular solute-binding protein [Clostridium sp. C105KSO13]CUX38629.1 Arginine utilization regulatory protein RocR [Clostridium sp. C105KSO13]